MSPPTATFVVRGLGTVVTRTCMNKPPGTKFIISHMRYRLLYTSQKTISRITPDLLTCHNSSLRTVEEKWGFSQLQNCNTKQVKIRYMHLNALKLPKLKYDSRCLSAIKIIANKHDIIESFLEEVTYP